VGRCLSQAPGTRYLNEPDNENIHPFAVRAKRGLGRYPVLGLEDEAPADYERLWAAAMAAAQQPGGIRGRLSYRLYNPVRWQAHPEGRSNLSSWGRARLETAALLATPGRPAPLEHLVVKSVFLAFAVEWLLKRWDGRVVVAVRDPLNTIASWWALGWRDVLGHHPAFVGRSTAILDALRSALRDMDIPALPPSHSQLQRLSWQFGLLDSALLHAYRRRPDWIIARHDELCETTIPAFRDLFARTQLPWGDAVEEFLRRSNRPGAGAFDTTRVAGSESTRWRERLTEDQVSEVMRVLERFDLAW